MNHSVFFTSSDALGLDDYDAYTHSAVPAWKVLHFLKKPREGDDMSSKWAMRRYEEAKKFLEELDNTMIEIFAAGVVVGEYHIRPYLLHPKQYAALVEMELA